MPEKVPVVDFAENKDYERSIQKIDMTNAGDRTGRFDDVLSFAPAKNIYVDMDGVLAVFNQVESEEVLMQKWYYAGLDPQMNVVNAVKDLAKRNDVQVFVLSAVLPSPYAREEKEAWLDRYLPEVDDAHRIFLPCGDDKSRYIGHTPDKTDLLLDDYSKNLLEWSPPGKAVKLMNNINGNFGTWKGERISMDLPPRVIEAKLLNCLDIQHNLGKDSVSFEITGCEVHSEPVETMGDSDPRTANFPVSTDYDLDSDLGLRKGSTRMWVEYCPVPGKEQMALYYKNSLKSNVQEFPLSDKQKGELKNAVEAYCESKYGRNALSWIETALELREMVDSEMKEFKTEVDREIDNIVNGRAQDRKDKTPIREENNAPQGKNGIAGYVEAFGKKSGKTGSKNIGRD